MLTRQWQLSPAVIAPGHSASFRLIEYECLNSTWAHLCPKYPGALGPAYYGALIGNGSSRTGLFVGYLVGAGIMLTGGLVEVFLGVNAAGKSLEQITKPLTSVGEPAPATTTGA